MKENKYKYFSTSSAIYKCNIHLFIYFLDMIRFKKILKIIWKIILVIAFLLFVLLRSGTLYINYQNSDKQLLQKLQKIDQNVHITYHTSKDWYQIRYADLGNPTWQRVMLLYGTPGNILDRENVLTQTDILKKYHVIIPDRPGFWWSMRWHAMPVIQQQWDLLSELLPIWSGEKTILVWWSYAWALLPYIAAKHADAVKWIVVIAGIMDPEHQTIRKISYLLHYTPLRWIIPSMLRITDTEKLESIEQLKRIMPLRDSIVSPTYLLHGTKDWIVDPENSLFAQKMLKNAKVFYRSIDGIGHWIPIEMPSIVLDAINIIDEYSSGLQK